MASVEQRGKSTRVIAYIDGRKYGFALGRVRKKVAERFAANIDQLLHERRCGLTLSREVSNWLAELDDSLYDLLVGQDLAEARQNVTGLSAFIDQYIEKRTDVTERRVEKLRQAKKRLIEHFGDLEMDQITPGDADEYSRWLLKKVAPTTAQKECQIAAQFFRHAFRKGLIPKHPFDGVSVGTSTNEERQVFVPRDVVAKVIDKCPNWQWETVTALARYGGLRCSSEIALLKWSDIHWDTDRFTVTSPKTKRYGKASRIVPIFPELRPYLSKALEMADDHELWVVPMLEGKPGKNLSTTFKKIITRSGVDSWPKPFQNLRLSRQTELEQKYPTYVVCKWMGNTPNVAQKHYLKVTDEHFTEAAKVGTPWGCDGDKRGTQSPAADRKTTQEKSRTPVRVRDNAKFADVVNVLQNVQMAGTGFEPATSRL